MYVGSCAAERLDTAGGEQIFSVPKRGSICGPASTMKPRGRPALREKLSVAARRLAGKRERTRRREVDGRFRVVVRLHVVLELGRAVELRVCVDAVRRAGDHSGHGALGPVSYTH